MATKRIYVATNPVIGTRLIRAGNASQVGRHIAAAWQIEPATAEDIARNRDVVIEDVGSEDVPQ